MYVPLFQAGKSVTMKIKTFLITVFTTLVLLGCDSKPDPTPFLGAWSSGESYAFVEVIDDKVIVTTGLGTSKENLGLKQQGQYYISEDGKHLIHAQNNLPRFELNDQNQLINKLTRPATPLNKMTK